MKRWSRRRTISRASEKLVLVPLALHDVDDFVASIDDEVVRWQGFEPEVIEKLRVGRAKLVPTKYDGWPCELAVRDRTTNDFLGQYEFTNIGPGGTSAHLGWWLGAQARGRGLGTESLTLALEYAHTDIHLRRVIMGTTRENVRAAAQIRRTGGVLTHEAPHTLPNGQIVEALWFQHAAP
jgi:RimJ/RimL family protein N-acetyltransferase